MTRRARSVLLALTCVLALGLLSARVANVNAQTDAGVTDAPAPRPLRHAQIHARSFTLSGHDYLAAEGGDLDADGRDEVLLVRAGAVGVVRVPLHGASLEEVASLALPVVTAPLFGRRVFATARVRERVARVRISERATEFELSLHDGAIALREEPPPCGPHSYPLGDVCGVRVEGRDYFASELLPLPGRAQPRVASSSFYSRRARSFPRDDGAPTEVEAVVSPSGRLSVSVGDRAASLLGVGAALALGDLEGDHEPELLTSEDVGPDGDERLLLFRLRLRDGRLTRLYRSAPLTGRVLVAGSGDLDGDGDDELFAIEEFEDDSSARLWVLP